jgi:hypothetical protein
VSPNDWRCAPQGKFRLVGYDQFSYADYLVGDFATLEEARGAARAQAAVPNGSPTSFSDVFFVYDDRRICMERVTYDDLQREKGLGQGTD